MPACGSVGVFTCCCAMPMPIPMLSPGSRWDPAGGKLLPPSKMRSSRAEPTATSAATRSVATSRLRRSLSWVDVLSLLATKAMEEAGFWQQGRELGTGVATKLGSPKVRGGQAAHTWGVPIQSQLCNLGPSQSWVLYVQSRDSGFALGLLVWELFGAALCHYRATTSVRALKRSSLHVNVDTVTHAKIRANGAFPPASFAKGHGGHSHVMAPSFSALRCPLPAKATEGDGFRQQGRELGTGVATQVWGGGVPCRAGWTSTFPCWLLDPSPARPTLHWQHGALHGLSWPFHHPPPPTLGCVTC